MRGFLFSLLLLGFAVPATAREWHAREGGFSVKAELVDVRNGAAVLKRDDNGQEISVPLDKLSLEDVRFVHAELERLTKAITGGMSAPAAGAPSSSGFSPPRAPSNEPATSSPAMTPAAANPASPVGSFSAKDDLGNYPTMPRTDAQAPPPATTEQLDWQASADPNPFVFALPQEKTVKSSAPQKSYSLKPQFPEHPSHFVFFEESSKNFFAFHLPTQKLAGSLHFNSSLYQNIAYSVDGHYFAATVRNSATNKLEVQVWSFATGHMVRAFTSGDSVSSLTSVRFVGPDRILIGNASDRSLQCFDIATGRKLCQVSIDHYYQDELLAVSPGGSYAALNSTTDKTVRIYDLRTGIEAGQVGGAGQIPNWAFGKYLSFSPDGEELLLYSNLGSGKHLITWDMRTGQKGVELNFPEDPGRKGTGSSYYSDRPLEWRFDRSGWLISGRVFVERTSPAIVWADTTTKTTTGQGQPRRFVDNDRFLDFNHDADRKLTLTLGEISSETLKSNREMIASGATAFDQGLPPLTPIVDDRIQEIVTDIQWKYQPDAAPTVADGTLHDGARVLANFPQLGHMYVCRPSNRALIGLREPEESRRLRNMSIIDEQYFDLVDLKTGKPLMRTKLPFATQLMAIAPTGDWAAFADKDNKERVDLFDLTTGKPAVAFRPFQNSRGQIAALEFGSGNSTLWVLSVDGELTQWKLPECRVVARRMYGKSTRLQSSPSGRTLCVASPQKMELLDADSGAMLGTLASPGVEKFTAAGKLAFSDDGRKLVMACYVGEDAQRILVWDLVANNVEKSFPFPYKPLDISWGSDDVVLVRVLSRIKELTVAAHLVAIHLPSERIGWNYLLPFGAVGFRGSDGRQWYVAGDTNQTDSTVRAVQLPQPEDAELIDDLQPLAPMLASGDRLGIRVDAEVPTLDLQRNNLAKELQDLFVAKALNAGYNPDPDAQYVLTIEVREKLTPESLRLRVIGQLFVESIQVTEVVGALRITNGDGKLVWTDEIREKTHADLITRGIPPGARLSEYFRVQQWKNVLKWLADVKVPAAIFDSSSVTGAGVSVMTVNGLEVRQNLTIPVNEPVDKSI
ncbi:hypothetical protein LOC68_12975 [Blastopirellula sp. JC732]|uniref:SLA1 homology domain-containing protein n=1 Tax=Blastopirellula sediminis TaxID=2894196 RepID=A0A9X1MN85_9BACT|nr:SHD1 domain-containing protein [Blastopirellula sediminis]MCC9607397.1 hypothetical protein [Blastopirellula sediminis]MCC9629310.1 hypothetical protein [Blastopirellula sediminis]